MARWRRVSNNQFAVCEVNMGQTLMFIGAVLIGMGIGVALSAAILIFYLGKAK